MLLKWISLLIFLAPISKGANILAILPTPSYSHQVAYTQIWKELSLRGHKVTVITTDPLKDPKLTNLTEIDVNWSYDYYSDLANKVKGDAVTMWNVYQMFQEKVNKIFRAQIEYPPVQDLIHKKSSFDVVLVEFLYPQYLAFAEIFNCPKILFSSMDVSQHFHRAVGNPVHPILNPDLVMTFHGTLNFKERVISTVFSWYLSYIYAHEIISSNGQLLKQYFNATKSLEELISEVDLMFTNVNPAIQGIAATGPTTINIGGQRRPLSDKPLPNDLQEFLDSAKDGFIYFSLGSNVKSKELSEKTLQAIIETLREVPYKVLWKFEADDLPGKPENVKLVKWAPQQNVLIHPNIKLFVTQGGLQSMEEAIYSTVPTVVIPFFGDQEKNGHLMVAKGIAKIVDRHPFVKKSEIKDAILEVINNPSYKKSVERLKQLALDTPMTGLETAIRWTEYVIRNKGAKHLRNPAADIPLYQYYLLDVISFLILSILLVLSVAILLVKRIVKTIQKLVGTFASKKKVQ